MPREVRTELTALINSGRCNWHTTVDITLTGGVQIFLSTGEIFVDRFGKTQQYIGKMARDVGELEMSLDVEVDGMDFKASNVDMAIGRTLTGATRRLDGAEAIVGILFIDPALPLEDAIWDAKMPCEVMSGEVTDPTVDFSLVSAIDSVIISGRSIADEFQWQEPISTAPLSDPDDLDPGRNNRDPDTDLPGRRIGRYWDYEPAGELWP